MEGTNFVTPVPGGTEIERILMSATVFRPWNELRLLYSVGSSPHDGEAALLSAWVGCCTGPGEQQPHTGYVALDGELCAYTSSLLRDPLFDFVAYAGGVVVDLGRLRFIDSAGVAVLQELRSRQLAHGGFVQFHDAQPFVRKVIRLVATAGSGTADPAQRGGGTGDRRNRTRRFTVEYGNRRMLHLDDELMQPVPNRPLMMLDGVPFVQR
jgi:anti-anti-sigma factor